MFRCAIFYYNNFFKNYLVQLEIIGVQEEKTFKQVGLETFSPCHTLRHHNLDVLHGKKAPPLALVLEKHVS